MTVDVTPSAPLDPRLVEAASAWLTAQSRHEAVATGWPQWERLLRQAGVKLL